jgi:hypothetical protein
MPLVTCFLRHDKINGVVMEIKVSSLSNILVGDVRMTT